MQIKFFFLLLGLGSLTLCRAQEQRLLLTAGFQFHSLGLPFKTVKENFKNLGLSVGTRYQWNKNGALVQDLQLSWLVNRKVGNSLNIYTQLGWQPRLFGAIHLGPQLGLGYSWLEHPVESFEQKNGEWVARGRGGKAVLSVPVGFSLRLAKQSNLLIQPYVSYQMLIFTNYNQGLPILPSTMLQIGSQIPLN